jgi:hypothetical protein
MQLCTVAFFVQTRAELLRQKYDDVAFDLLQRLLYEREAILALEVVKCLAALMAKVDHRYSQPFEVIIDIIIFWHYFVNQRNRF